MTNAETITKLNDALEKLINAYEILQNSYDELEGENKKLNEEIKNLKEKVNHLEAEKRDLEDNVNVLEDTKEKDTNNMNNMLTKIEGLLGKKKGSLLTPDTNKTDTSNPNEYKKEEEGEEKPSAVKDARAAMGEIVVDSKSKEEPSDSDTEKGNSSSENKIDLNRMASLLNGFNSN